MTAQQRGRRRGTRRPGRDILRALADTRPARHRKETHR